MELFGIFAVVGIVTCGFLTDLNARKEKPSAQETLGKATDQQIELGIKVKLAKDE